jgi:CRISPR-associated protein Cas2
MQTVILVYDIVEDGLRAKIATVCADYGLDRVQYSVFIGLLTRNMQEELMLRIDSLLIKGHGNVRLIPIGKREWENQLEVNYA